MARPGGEGGQPGDAGLKDRLEHILALDLEPWPEYLRAVLFLFCQTVVTMTTL